MTLKTNISLSQFEVPEVIRLSNDPQNEGKLIDYINEKLKKAFDVGRMYERAELDQKAK